MMKMAKSSFRKAVSNVKKKPQFGKKKSSGFKAAQKYNFDEQEKRHPEGW